jgi:hypothetical protein
VPAHWDHSSCTCALNAHDPLVESAQERQIASYSLSSVQPSDTKGSRETETLLGHSEGFGAVINMSSSQFAVYERVLVLLLHMYNVY